MVMDNRKLPLINGIEHAGQALKQHRKAVGMTQLELARLSNVAQSSISDIETGTVTPRSC
ncbi:XRE family transcriptional regulator [Leisingera sp. NJS204]|nr:XRE family transcriptional regulator [Leisingera sp. NJS204]